MSEQKNKINVGSIVNITFRLFIVCTIIAIVVAGVNALTKDRIAENEQNVVNNTIREVFQNGDISEIKADIGQDSSVNAVYKISDTKDKSILGYSVICAPKGFGGEVKMMVAFDSEKAVSAVKIMSHSETPGIGNKIENNNHPEFTEQFSGKKSELEFGKDGIDKISGSSKSSKAVLKGVNDAIKAVAKVK